MSAMTVTAYVRVAVGLALALVADAVAGVTGVVLLLAGFGAGLFFGQLYVVQLLESRGFRWRGRG